MVLINEIASLVIVVFTALTGILTFIEKSKILKWKPLSRLFKNNELNKKIDEISKKQEEFLVKLDSIESENDKREIKRLRASILDFANQKCEQGIKMTSDQERYFDDCCIDYENLIKKHNLTNGHTTESIRLVSDYRKMELQDKYKRNVKK